ncbi:uncharacterized protein C1orf94 homolog [Pezoporus wallicus]|uniref:uncharacterized protein C1orf94 homolog n=1 Tax=Pezoporus wallicus TaxID=35540 RepID=UPI00254F1BBD|nr:uncharacterized protein C1orf94 homolog [Pezoporus wallicus]
MLPGRNSFSASAEISEGPFPLGPFPRHIWIHSNTPQDGLDETCHEIWKRVQRLPEQLQAPLLVAPLQHGLCSELLESPWTDTTTSQSNNYLLNEPEGLESIYTAMIGKKEREMKLKALCDAQLSAKSVITGFLCPAKSHKNSKGLEDRNVTGTGSTESSKLEVPLVLKDTDTAKGTGSQAVAEETKVVKEVCPAKSTTAASSTAESEAPGQKEQLPQLAKTCPQTSFDAVTKNAVTTGTSDKRGVKYNASTSGFITASGITGLNQPVWQSLSFPLFPIFPNHFPQFQGLYPRVRIPFQQALHPSFTCYSGQVPLYSPQQMFPPPPAPIVNYITLVPPLYPYQQISPAALHSSIQDLPPMAGNGIQLPFSPSQGLGAMPGGAVTPHLNYITSNNPGKF